MNAKNKGQTMIYLIIKNNKDNNLRKYINITDYTMNQFTKTVDLYSKYCTIKLQRIAQ